MIGRMPLRLCASAMCLAAALFIGSATSADTIFEDNMSCDAAAEHAARVSDVPLDVLRAVTQTETGRGTSQGLQSWPWAMNVAGRSYWHDDRRAAFAHAQGLLAIGQTNFDIGCFQINYGWHGDQFTGLSEMLDPMQNAFYAAKFLATLHRETNDWSRAAGAYHSRTPHLAAQYRQRFDILYAALRDHPHQIQRHQNAFPLLQAGLGGGGLGSLVPLDREARP